MPKPLPVTTTTKHYTSDGREFNSLADAYNHAKTLLKVDYIQQKLPFYPGWQSIESPEERAATIKALAFWLAENLNIVEPDEMEDGEDEEADDEETEAEDDGEAEAADEDGTDDEDDEDDDEDADDEETYTDIDEDPEEQKGAEYARLYEKDIPAIMEAIKLAHKPGERFNHYRLADLTVMATGRREQRNPSAFGSKIARALAWRGLIIRSKSSRGVAYCYYTA